MSLNKNVSLINDNIQSGAISKLKTGRSVNHQVESIDKLGSSCLSSDFDAGHHIGKQ